jgi:ribose/xylose/arabinose/galactoside ABC-type transport system permease subunit
MDDSQHTVKGPFREVSRLIRRIDLNSVQVQLIVGIAIVAAVFGFLYPDRFATWRNLENMARQGGTLAVVAIGQSFALISGGFDISVAATMGLASTFGALALIEYGIAAGIAAGLAAGLAVGLINGTLIARLGVTPFVATLGMLAIARGLANLVSDGRSVSGIPAAFDWFGGGDWGPIPATVGMAAVVFVVASFVLYRTRPGLYLYATGGSEAASRLAGVNVVRSEMFAYLVCGLLAGVGGLMLASRVSVGQASLGQGFELMSIATAVIGGVAIGGGVGRLSGVVLGVALMSVLSTGMNIAQLSEFTQEIITGVVLIAAVLIDRVRVRGRQRQRVEYVIDEEIAQGNAAA